MHAATLLRTGFVDTSLDARGASIVCLQSSVLVAFFATPFEMMIVPCRGVSRCLVFQGSEAFLVGRGAGGALPLRAVVPPRGARSQDDSPA